MSLFTWIATIICLTGTVFNCKKMKICFYLWIVGNLLWFAFDLHSGLYSRAALDTVQLALAVYGIYEWSKKRQHYGLSNSSCPL